ncbi:MAG: META domain-containing protein [Treponema sp.]|jgi:heat shock protein HslJ|nr:META domain-containing protein [Treponema sp.]
MKKLTIITFCTILALAVFATCAGGATIGDSQAATRGSEDGFNEYTGKELILSEFRSSGKTVSISRKNNDMGDIYTINFQNGRVNGKGAPNTFFGPYTVNGNMLNIGPLASTLMAAIIEPDELKEHEYFEYLDKVTKWDISKGNLELYSSNGVVLVFTLK